MVKQEHLPLWNRIEQFPIDDRQAAVPFSGKLAAQQGWSAEFTAKAIAEYRKFTLLCCISELGASPSKIVDEVWHLHLTYTQSYWTDFCGNILKRELHHHPSSGGDLQDEWHREWYKKTGNLYREVFGTEPPAEIWPGIGSGKPQEKLQKTNADNLSTDRGNQPVSPLEERHLTWDGGMVAFITLLLAFPFLVMWWYYGTLNPFSLGGPHFLVFFPCYGFGIIAAYVVYRYHIKKHLEDIVLRHLSADVPPFQVADLLYGKHRALQTGLVDLLQRQLIELTPQNQFAVRKENYTASVRETNPLISGYAGEDDGAIYSYDSIMANWYDRGKFSHPELEALKDFAQRREPFYSTYIFPILFFALAVARTVQGIMNDRPITLLVLEIAGYPGHQRPC